ncbi:type IV toxin-antitoxin system AbiEi family antitoxin domain-containing protein [Nocardioides sp. CFH 31398]|uniref:type IV toxin-antitoxin system AbiEi family antitoxin domain-containing protein n=1 Tax=Nocardioides sp. CFH 31398 TaxID=2919579 RepID=UPI001F06FCE7|nr:type IV toxin-antitoxin system AbiEi family antitoxin domain-containing protein [Nocardioides sp. CFH 31398]MCH1867843.1 type IV toxin-antitoxin system AbiEi family antitoxin domain-containing protein [Nocardioides sp. CFH 31398]
MGSTPLPSAVLELLERQDGVIARRQALGAGLAPHDLKRLVRRREWARIDEGVFVNHTGRTTWHQRAWAGVLRYWPAVLHGGSALRAVDGDPRHGDVVHLAIDRERTRPASRPGMRFHHVVRLGETAQWQLSPPRQRLEDAVIDVAAAAADDLSAVHVLASAVGSRRTTADRLLRALRGRTRVRRREWLDGVLADVRAGTCSVLEHGYLTRVERPHGLPSATRQARGLSRTGVVYRDAEYEGGAVVELDGRLHHEGSRQRESDLARDLEVAARGGATVRLGYRQVMVEHCWTADAVHRFLVCRGVPSRAVPCGPGCPVARQRPGSGPPGGPDPGR